MLGEVGPPEVSPEMEWGNRLEDAVLQKFIDVHPELWVERTGTWRNCERSWQTGNPDALSTDRWVDVDGQAHPAPGVIHHLDQVKIVEIKTAHDDTGWGAHGSDVIPIHYRAQVMWYMDTLGCGSAWVAVLIGGSDYREYLIKYDPTDALYLRQVAHRFLDDLVSGHRPDVDADGATYQVIKELHPDITSDTIDVPDDLGVRFIRARTLLTRVEAAYNLARNRLADEMGNAHYAYWRGRKIADRRAKKATGSLPYLQVASRLPSIDTPRSDAA